jgi:hypothetical protein
MKSQYPFNPITYQNSEPEAYLKTFDGLRQMSAEKVKIIKTECLSAEQKDGEEQSSMLNKEEDDGLASFFYTQSFTLSDED